MSKKNDLESLTLSDEQQKAFNLLKSGENVFLTGGAGSGKSFVVREFTKDIEAKTFPTLASTGAAAVLLGGRTFHSFFGLGILEGGAQATLERGLKDGKLMKRLAQSEGVIIDEISMISGEALQTAEQLSQAAKKSHLPWGGLQVIAVGDFAQLPPVTRFSQKRDWSFLTESWKKTKFIKAELHHNQRIQDSEFLDVLSDIRNGLINDRVIDFLNDHTQAHDEDHPGTRLFPRREQSESYNQKKLNEIQETEIHIDSIFLGEERFVEALKKNAPVPEKLKIKVGARVLFLKNDTQKRWVNGTRGIVTDYTTDTVVVRKETSNGLGREVKVEKMQFSLLDADGNIKASVIQFPLALAYATTIHKSQGATLDELWCDLGNLWEPGQAYVALSRLRTPQGLHIVRWNPKSILIDPEVKRFYGHI